MSCKRFKTICELLGESVIYLDVNTFDARNIQESEITWERRQIASFLFEWKFVDRQSIQTLNDKLEIAHALLERIEKIAWKKNVPK